MIVLYIKYRYIFYPLQDQTQGPCAAFGHRRDSGGDAGLSQVL